MARNCRTLGIYLTIGICVFIFISIKMNINTTRVHQYEQKREFYPRHDRPFKMGTHSPENMLGENGIKKHLVRDDNARKLQDSENKIIEEWKVKQYKPKYVSSASNNCSVLLNDDDLVRNCITGDVIGRVPKSVEFEKYLLSDEGSLETMGERAHSFKNVFDTRAWGHSWDKGGSRFNASGRGATIPWTQELSASLHSIINEIKRKTGKTRVRLLDVPCGDLAWMSRFLKTRNDVDYTGIDIVSSLIEHHKTTYKHQAWRFLHKDILTWSIDEKYDVILSRTLMQHLFRDDIKKLLGKLSCSGSGYLMATTFAMHDFNQDLQIHPNNPGRFRKVNLEIPPYNLKPPHCIQRDAPPDDFEGWDHYIAIWRLPLYKIRDCKDGKKFKMMGSDKTIYSCVEWSPYIDLS